MPELPEVETTVVGLKKEVVDLRILDAWTDLNTKDKRKKETVANPGFFKFFKKNTLGAKIVSAERRAKNILLNLSNKKTVLVHMKMTGHLLYGEYRYLKKENKWVPKVDGPLADPFNRFVHFVFCLSNKKHLVFSDTRKFGKITLLDTETAHDTKHLNTLGLDPFDKNLNRVIFRLTLQKKPNGKIKTVLMDQTLISGIGNIYSDEILWHSAIHPERRVKDISISEFDLIFKNAKSVLKKGIDFGGDSMSDYRNIYGEKGKFQMHHNAYRKTGQPCSRKNCAGVIMRSVIGGRSAHFCNKHQK